MTNQLELHVGYIGKTSEGQRVNIIEYDESELPFKGDNGLWYNKSGDCVGRVKSNIIGPWTEPEAEYEVGKWYGWNGGPCPVHPETLLDVTHVNGYVLRSVKAKDVLWKYPLMFRIIIPYVEPAPKLECWVNVYRDGSMSAHTSKEDAGNYLSLGDRIRCARMVEADEQ